MTRRIMVVDDSDEIREIAQLSLETFNGWEVAVAASGAEAVDAVRARQPDVVLLDVMMPFQDGPATLRMLRDEEITRDVPVVFMTARLTGWDQAKLDALGAQGLIAKPFDPTRLGDEVSDLLDWGA